MRAELPHIGLDGEYHQRRGIGYLEDKFAGMGFRNLGKLIDFVPQYSMDCIHASPLRIISLVRSARIKKWRLFLKGWTSPRR